MKSGLIVYLVGGAELPEGIDLAGQCRDLGFPADRVELVGANEGFYDVQEAWHFLLTQGYGHIQLLVAKPEDHKLRPVHPLVRLYG
jgi:hypothetical protein